MRTRKRFNSALRSVSLLIVLAISEKTLAMSNDYSAAIRLAVDRWLVVQKPSGFLPYGFNFLEDEESEPDNLSTSNLARQISTAAVLADYYALTNDQRARPAIEKFLTAFRRHSLPIGKSRMQRLVEKTHLLSIPVGRYKILNALEWMGLLFDKEGPGKVLSPNGDYSKAYAGSVALALLTELRYAQVSGDSSFSDLRQAWLEAIMDLRIPGEGFRRFPTSIDPTPYADGQVWLALAQYHHQFPQDRRVDEMLTDVDDTLIDIYGSDVKIDFYHWGTMAAAARYADSKEVKFLNFIKNQTSAFLYRKQNLDGDNNCASVEGLADALAALVSAGEGNSELSGRTREWIAREMTKAEGLQIQPGQKELAFANARVVAPRLEEFAGSFLAGRDELITQVDYTSHCVSAMIKLQRQNRPVPKD